MSRIMRLLIVDFLTVVNTPLGYIRGTKEINKKAKEAEGKFGTGGAIATAFVTGFLPRLAV
ncbi:hypothetical protein D3C81_2083550 [compost metagenome]